MNEPVLKIVLAAVPVAASALGGLLSWVQARRSARSAAQAALDLHRAQALESRWTHALRAVESDSRVLGDAMAEAWQAIQDLREEIAKLLNVARYDVDFALERLSRISGKLTDSYAEHGGRVPEAVRNVWHRAKNTANTCRAKLDESLKASPAQCLNSELPNTTNEILRNARSELRNCQDVLANEQRRLLASMVRDLIASTGESQDG